MKVRQRRSCREFSVESQDDSDNREALFEIPDQGWSPEDLYRAEECLNQVSTAISSLDPLSQHLLRLRMKQDYSMEEIAQAMNISEPAVKSRLRRARCALRELCPATRCNDTVGQSRNDRETVKEIIQQRCLPLSLPQHSVSIE